MEPTMTEATSVSPIGGRRWGGCSPTLSSAKFLERCKVGRADERRRRTGSSTGTYDCLPSERELAALADVGLTDAQIGAYWRLAPSDVAILRRGDSL
jgi:hypothetical protein